MVHKYSKEEIENIVKDCCSIADFCRKLGWQPRGDNYKIFHQYVRDYGIDISHFTGKRSNIGNKNNCGKEKPVESYLKNGTLVRGSTLIKKLISSGFKEYKCENCGIATWLGEPVHLELHHIDGDHFNNELDNLKLLCPNCHSMTDNFRGKNIKTNETVCKNCGKKLRYKNDNGLCRECYDKLLRKKKRPEKETLENLLSEKSRKEVADLYDVSEAAVRKWIKFYEIN